MSQRILVADDEATMRFNLCEFLQRSGYEAAGAADGQQALEMLRDQHYDLLITDINMPELDGISLLKRVVVERPQTFVLIVTAYASVESAVEALRFGAYDYLLKPVVFEDLLQKINNLEAMRDLKDEVQRLRRDMQRQKGEIVGESQGMKRVLQLVEMVAPTSSTALITGESGTGKELAARTIHNRSKQAPRPFLAVNVAAIPSEMLEAQLFGHVKGAFTGATQHNEGLLRHARGGTVFLDEVGELTSSAQAKLLRALDVKEVLPVGSDRPVQVDFRLIAATNRRLEDRVAEGSFREDLFYRLNVFRIEIPPLRERREDIPPLVDHWVDVHRRNIDRRVVGVSNEAMRLMMSYPWPGNVRELSNVIERAVILALGGTIDVEHLPTEFHEEDGLPTSLQEAVQEAERRHILWALGACGGSREEAAKLLQIDRATLYRRLTKYGIK